MNFTENIETTVLPNGVRVISETVPHVQSVSIGIWVGAGSRYESKPIRGITHFIEHMLFKGTGKRDARQIADEIESRGGSLNAFTDKEFTCYYAKALATDAGLVVDVLTDMLLGSQLDPEEMEREKNVVIEEIKRYQDSPDDTVHDLFQQTLWGTHPLGRPIIGTDKTVAGLARQDLVDYMTANYTPDRVVLAAAGNVPHSMLVDLGSKLLGGISGKPPKQSSPKLAATGLSKLQRKRTEQIHFCLGGPGVPQTHDDRYVLTLIDSVLGGNMSSRLFQEIREKRGLAYSIGSYTLSYRDGGMFSVYGGTSPDTFDQVVDLSRKEIDKVVKEGLSEDEVTKAKNQVRGALVLGLENMSSRMMRMGKSVLYFNKVVPLDEIVKKVEAVTHDDIARVSNNVLNSDNLTLTAIGSFKKEAA